MKYCTIAFQMMSWEVKIIYEMEIEERKKETNAQKQTLSVVLGGFNNYLQFSDCRMISC